MSLCVVQSRALLGLSAEAVRVEVHLANGLPSFTLVGLADVEVKEARERVRSALQTCGLTFPHNQRITVNLAPADLPKDSGRFDLPIAVGILAASGQIDAARLAGYAFAGELSLSGELRPVRGALARVGRRSGGREAAHHVHQVLRPPHLRAGHECGLFGVAGRQHQGDRIACRGHRQAQGDGWTRIAPRPLAPPDQGPDLADVKGQAGARRALEIAAAGGHGLLLIGPPGSGKSMLAQRFAGLLPPMTMQESLESAAVSSLAGPLPLAHWGQRPTRSPHHTASAVALVGGGSPPRPGEISLAHGGVLFLDELPEFPRAALEALREPLETGQICIARAARQAQFPARFQLVAAMNPCPCGWLGSACKACRCTPDQVSRYQARISGPLLDRIDLQVEVPALSPGDLLDAPAGEASAIVRARCTQARQRAVDRQGHANQQLASRALDQHAALSAEASRFLQATAQRLGWSARATHRALKVARTIADLADAPRVDVPHLAEAIQYRRGLGPAAA